MSDKMFRIHDLLVGEVSVVHKGANKRPLLMIKTEEETASEETVSEDTEDLSVEASVTDEDFGADPPEVAEEEAPATAEEPVVEASTEPAPAADGPYLALGKHLQDLGNVLAGASVEDTKAHRDVLLKTVAALRDAAFSDDASSPLAKLLPESAPTIPVSDSPPEYVMTEAGPVVKLAPEAMRKMACNYTKDTLCKAMDSVWTDDLSGAAEHLVACLQALMPFAPLAKRYADNQPQASIPVGVPDSKPAPTEQPSPRKDLAKSFADLQAALGGMTQQTQINKQYESQVEMLANLIKSLRSENAQLRSTRPVGNAIIDNDEVVNNNTPTFRWPDDLNEDSDL